MTRAEFFAKTLLQIAGNSAFGNDNQGSYYSITGWAKKIMEASLALLDEAENCGILDEYLED